MQPEKYDANLSFNSFYDTLEKIIEKHMPLRKITNKEHKQRYKPWITNEILQSMRRRDTLLKKYIKLKDIERRNIVFSEYKKLRNEILEKTRRSKSHFYRNYFEENNKNLRKIWQGIREIINIKNKASVTPTSLMTNNKQTTNPYEISNSFNTYYSNIADNILKERKYEGHPNLSFMNYMPRPQPESIAFHAVDGDDVYYIIKELNVNKATGPCSIPSKVLNLIKAEISRPLSWIANICFTTGVHPDKLKLAKVIPVYKKGSKLLTCNYRPISLLSNINKIFEKIVFSNLYSFLDKQNSIYDLQFGFRPKHSTTHALINITEKIREALDKGEYACGIFVDLQKAFDTVNHDILLAKLYRYGVRGVAYDWFKSYLTNRNQYVSILGFESNKLIIQNGVPQGSVLGPLLFLIYINDLHNAIKYSSTYLFADDTNLLNINKSTKKMEKQMNYDLKGLYWWLLANKISLNATKTEMIIFRKPCHETPIELHIKINGQRLYPCKCIKYLGVYLDEHLRGSAHIEILLCKLRRANGMLAKSRHYTSPEQIKSIYHAIFASHMMYGCQIWGHSPTNTYINKIQILQNNALRLITFAPDFRDHISPVYRQLNLLKLKDIIVMKNLLFIHDYFNNKLPQSFRDYYILDKDKHMYEFEQIRSTQVPDKFNEFVLTEPTMQPQEHPIPGQIYKPEYDTVKYGRDSFKYSSITSWNNLNKKYFKINPQNNFITLSRPKFKELIVREYLSRYESVQES